jgi:hypothetical protein
MANNQLTFADRERASGLFGTTRGYSQGNAPASASQLKSAQSNYLREQGNALGGRLTQSQIEKAQRYADSMGVDFDSSAGYVPKGYGKTPRASSSQRRDDRKARSAATGNTISKGGAAGIASGLGQMLGGAPLGSREAGLRMKMLFSREGLTDAEKKELGVKEIGKYYDNVPRGGLFDMVAEGRDPSKQYYSDGTYAGQVLSGAFPSNIMGSQSGITSGLQGLSMGEKNLLSSQGLLGSYMNSNQSGSQMGSLMGTSALNKATGGYFG